MEPRLLSPDTFTMAGGFRGGGRGRRSHAGECLAGRGGGGLVADTARWVSACAFARELDAIICLAVAGRARSFPTTGTFFRADPRMAILQWCQARLVRMHYIAALEKADPKRLWW